MKTTVSNAATVMVVLFLSTATFAQKGKGSIRPAPAGTSTTCPMSLKTQSGKVYSAAPGQVKIDDCKSDEITITVTKTDGKAETQVNVLVDGQMRPNPINFDNGNYIPPAQKRTVTGVKGRNVVVQIVNQSVGNTFSYSVNVNGDSDNIIIGDHIGSLLGNAKSTFLTTSNCGNSAKFTVQRLGGNARGTIRIWEMQSNGTYTEMLDLSTTIEQDQPYKDVVVNSNKPLKVELKNVSIGNNLGYKVNVTPLN